ncbi:hypothetical protein ACFSC4_14100 [Deinococcus malanensis]|uniref:hypothetical protein n=1 Tax=Deinococcus malanensis TaxID=1706855 RepID=UPI0036405811
MLLSMAPGLTADSPTKALPAVTLSTTGEALAVMHLPAELHNLPLELNLIGDLPPGIHVTYPGSFRQAPRRCCPFPFASIPQATCWLTSS